MVGKFTLRLGGPRSAFKFPGRISFMYTDMLTTLDDLRRFASLSLMQGFVSIFSIFQVMVEAMAFTDFSTALRSYRQQPKTR
ncbi:hypothetical protein L0F63_003879, partial [Massospora cicadina]